MKNIYQGNFEHPFHVSVGAVVLNDKNQICCHHFKPKELEGYWADECDDEFYLLMRKSIKPNTDLEETVHKGVREEFGIEGKIIDYIGSIQSHYEHKNVKIEKTTIYFLMKMNNQDLSKRGSGIDSQTDLEWQTPDFLISEMKKYNEKFGRSDMDESKILEEVKKRLK